MDKALDLNKQMEYISALQKHWGLELNTRVSRNELPILDIPLFQRPLLGNIGVPLGYQVIGKFRVFVIVVTISEHAFDGSFHIELRPRGVPNVLINKVSFLRRRLVNHCAACIGRQASHALVRATMIMDSSDIHRLIHGAGFNRRDARDNDIIQLLKTSFEARIVTPGGQCLAESRHGLSGLPNIRSLTSGIPKMRFYSASACHPIGNPNGDIQFFNWVSHFSLLDNDWVDRR